MSDIRRALGAVASWPFSWITAINAMYGEGQWREVLRQWLRIEAERRRIFLWLPIGYGIGIGLYFSASEEPVFWIAPVLAILAILTGLLLRHHWRLRMAVIFIGAIFLGFAAGSWRTYWVSQPLLSRPYIGNLQGYVRSVEDRLQGPRAVIEVETFADLAPEHTPKRVRVTFRKGIKIKAGTWVSMIARLVPLPEPARPGGYDFARDAFFNGIGAVGSVNGAVTLINGPHAHETADARLAAQVDIQRNRLTERIMNTAGGPMEISSVNDKGKSKKLPKAAHVREQEAAFVAALITGKRGFIAEETNEILRAAGIFHVVSIGGFHMTLVAGTFFFLTRGLLALIPGLAIRYPIRKVAAIVGIIGASVYCAFSGAGIDTQRALFVTLIVMGAILVDRPALSMRNLALSGLVCMTLQPETLLGPSFQMSFAGVAALIALFERWNKTAPSSNGLPLREGGTFQLPDIQKGRGRLYKMTVTSVITTLVAMLATGPFSTYHFQTFNPWGIVGNAFGLPLVELVIMPLAFCGVALYPLGLDGIFWYLAGLASVPVLEGSRIIAEFPGAMVVVPAFGMPVLLLFVLAIMWACFWTTALRWLSILPALLGLILAAMPALPTVRIDREGRGAAVRGQDGRLVVIGSPSAFVVEQWLKADGDRRRANDPTLKSNVLCDKMACVTSLPGGNKISFVRDQKAFAEDCQRAALIITPLRAPFSCSAPHIIDRQDLSLLGAVALTYKDDILFVEGSYNDNTIAYNSDAAPDNRLYKNLQRPPSDENGRPWKRSLSSGPQYRRTKLTSFP